MDIRNAINKFVLLFRAALFRALSGLYSLIGKEKTATKYDMKASTLISDAAKIDENFADNAQQGAQQTINDLKNLGKKLGITKDEMTNALSGMSLNTDLAAKIKNNATQIQQQAKSMYQQGSDLEAKYSEKIEGILTYLASMDLTSSKREKYIDKNAKKHQERMKITKDANTFSGTVTTKNGMQVTREAYKKMQANNPRNSSTLIGSEPNVNDRLVEQVLGELRGLDEDETPGAPNNNNPDAGPAI